MTWLINTSCWLGKSFDTPIKQGETGLKASFKEPASCYAIGQDSSFQANSIHGREFELLLADWLLGFQSNWYVLDIWKVKKSHQNEEGGVSPQFNRPGWKFQPRLGNKGAMKLQWPPWSPTTAPSFEACDGCEAEHFRDSSTLCSFSF